MQQTVANGGQAGMPRGSPRITRVRALDGLRGAAVAAVLLFHAGRLTGGYLGVDLFFVLSGYLITGLLVAEWRGSGGVRLSAFWSRRARRLLPALFLMLAGVGLFAAFVAAPTELARIRGDALATLGYVANWHAITAGHDYWAIFGAPSPLDHTWSLAIEEQFYVLWPLLVLGLVAVRNRPRLLPRRVFVVALGGAVALAGVALGLTLSGASDARVYYGTDARAPAILLGAALAAASVWWGPARSAAGRLGIELAGVVGIGWLAWSWTQLGGQDPFLLRGGLLACGVAAVAVLAAAAQPRRGPIALALSAAPLCWLGLISYGLYLWHWPVYLWLDTQRTGLGGWSLTGVRVGVSLALAVTSYVLVEQPIRHGALRGWRIRVLTPVAAACTVAVVLVATTGAVTQPTTTQTIAAGRRLLAGGAPSPPPTTPRILIVGDSVGWSLGLQLDAVKQSLGVASFNGGVVGCQVPRADAYRAPAGFYQALAGRDGPAGRTYVKRADCKSWVSRWSSQLAQVHPDHVILTLGFPAVEDDEVNGAWYTACSPGWLRYYQSEFTDALRVLGSTGAHVWVTTIARSDQRYVTATRMTDCFNRVLVDAAAITHASVLDVDGYLCPRGRCRDSLAGQELRPDGIHFLGPGGRVLAAWVVNHVTARSGSPVLRSRRGGS